MRKLIFAAFLATSVMMSSSAMATEVHVSSTNPVIDLTISETVETPPDIATFSTGVQTMAPTASAAVRAHRRWLEVGGDEAQVLRHGQMLGQDIVLRTHTKAAAHLSDSSVTR